MQRAWTTGKGDDKKKGERKRKQRKRMRKRKKEIDAKNHPNKWEEEQKL